MADTVTTQVLSDTSGVKYVAKLTNISDGSGESLVTKVDASGTTFMSEDGNRKIAKIWFSVNTTNPKACVELLGGQGYWDLRTAGDEITNNATTPTGDVLLSTRDFVVGDNYTILVEFR
jgi:hypothetical protein